APRLGEPTVLGTANPAPPQRRAALVPSRPYPARCPEPSRRAPLAPLRTRLPGTPLGAATHAPPSPRSPPLPCAIPAGPRRVSLRNGAYPRERVSPPPYGQPRP